VFQPNNSGCRPQERLGMVSDPGTLYQSLDPKPLEAEAAPRPRDSPSTIWCGKHEHRDACNRCGGCRGVHERHPWKLPSFRGPGRRHLGGTRRWRHPGGKGGMGRCTRTPPPPPPKSPFWPCAPPVRAQLGRRSRRAAATISARGSGERSSADGSRKRRSMHRP
jgi:hypothetical protein